MLWPARAFRLWWWFNNTKEVANQEQALQLGNGFSNEIKEKGFWSLFEKKKKTLKIILWNYLFGEIILKIFFDEIILNHWGSGYWWFNW
jgi:hypothetical protein